MCGKGKGKGEREREWPKATRLGIARAWGVGGGCRKRRSASRNRRARVLWSLRGSNGAVDEWGKQALSSACHCSHAWSHPLRCFRHRRKTVLNDRSVVNRSAKGHQLFNSGRLDCIVFALLCAHCQVCYIPHRVCPYRPLVYLCVRNGIASAGKYISIGSENDRKMWSAAQLLSC